LYSFLVGVELDGVFIPSVIASKAKQSLVRLGMQVFDITANIEKPCHLERSERSAVELYPMSKLQQHTEPNPEIASLCSQ
jgi:hypothetical protein